MSAPPDSSERTCAYDAESIRDEFPILAQEVNGKPLVYLDNAATTQKPATVIDAVCDYYRNYNSNIHRGVHTLSQRATEAYELARAKLMAFLGAESPSEIIFLRGATEGINLVSQAWLRPLLEPGDEIILSEMEHHSNIVPWQLLREQAGAVLRVAPIRENGEVDLRGYEELFSDRTRFVSLTHVSNALGTINPIRQMVASARERGVPVLHGSVPSLYERPRPGALVRRVAPRLSGRAGGAQHARRPRGVDGRAVLEVENAGRRGDARREGP